MDCITAARPTPSPTAGSPISEDCTMTRHRTLARTLPLSLAALAALGTFLLAPARVRPQERRPSSYAPVVITEDFEAVVKRMTAAKPQIEKRQADLLQERYDLGNQPASGVSMSRGKPVQGGARVKLPPGVTSW